MEPGSDKPWSVDFARFQALCQQSQALVLLAEQTVARTRATRDQISRGRTRREVLHDSAFARLLAKQQTMAVIEQAKGIIMAQQECGPDEAFDLLRQASQRTNVKVHVLAARIVEQTVHRNNDGNVTPISLGARRYQQPRSRAGPTSG